MIANKCNFELWFVSAWLVGLGVGLMQVLVQLLVIASCAKKYQNATTPEDPGEGSGGVSLGFLRGFRRFHEFHVGGASGVEVPTLP